MASVVGKVGMITARKCADRAALRALALLGLRLTGPRR